MNVLQNELDEVCSMWNLHLIRHERSQFIVTGIPDELYYIPELQGTGIFMVIASHNELADSSCHIGLQM